ncbi:MAG TPA: hypothetical protein VJT14_04380 [Candidatus Dormibacteraeota bacterium]|nr:hypothetical protein [Candidatus Dormibacteraeota bacterium]
MPKVLTSAANITCPHQGKVTVVPNQTKFTIGGKPVLVDGDLDSAAISGCTWLPPPQANVACLTVATVSAGLSSKFKVGTKAVMLDSASGTTSGKVGPFNWSVQSAGETKFTSK